MSPNTAKIIISAYSKSQTATQHINTINVQAIRQLVSKYLILPFTANGFNFTIKKNFQ